MGDAERCAPQCGAEPQAENARQHVNAVQRALEACIAAGLGPAAAAQQLGLPPENVDALWTRLGAVDPQLMRAVHVRLRWHDQCRALALLRDAQ